MACHFAARLFSPHKPFYPHFAAEPLRPEHIFHAAYYLKNRNFLAAGAGALVGLAAGVLSTLLTGIPNLFAMVSVTVAVWWCVGLFVHAIAFRLFNTFAPQPSLVAALEHNARDVNSHRNLEAINSLILRFSFDGIAPAQREEAAPLLFTIIEGFLRGEPTEAEKVRALYGILALRQ